MTQRKRLVSAILIVLLAASLTTGFFLTQAANKQSSRPIPELSGAAQHSAFARVNNLGYVDINTPEQPLDNPESFSIEAAAAFNLDQNRRPQNEPTIAVNPGNPARYVGGANDYNVGIPIGGGVYAHDTGAATTIDRTTVITGFLPHPILAATGPSGPNSPFGSAGLLLEGPVGTGDPVLAYGKLRPGLTTDVVYYTTIGFAAQFCENGVFLYRSTNNGVTWTRPVVPPLAPPTGLRTVVYHDKGLECTVFHDKEWMTVDMGAMSPNKGRVIVTWTQFIFTNGAFIESPIMMAFSDDNGNTFSTPVEISGFSAALCGPQTTQPKGECDEDQGSVPVVGSDGTVYVYFHNFNVGPPFRSQILVVKLTPLGAGMGYSLSGPVKVSDAFDGPDDYPLQAAGTGNRRTLCNSNFRVNARGNIAVVPDGNANPADDTLYVVWSDDRAQAGQFPFPTRVIASAGGLPPFTCPGALNTDTDVFIMKSTNGGATWSSPAGGSTPLRVNQDVAGSDQWYPWVAVHPSVGAAPTRVDVMFHDRRRSATFGPPTYPAVGGFANRANHVSETVLARSLDGGVTWLESFVSDGSILTGLASPYNFDRSFFGLGTFMGDYNNMVIATNGKAYVMWTGVAYTATTSRADADVFVFVEP